ncbi:MAG: PHP domain-containing protein [Clostridiaceae bacterium]|nr:PHP domain-containing protein [Clostridiaceae bacterium]
MKKFKKAAAVFMAAAILMTFAPFSFAASDIDYQITNPYASVDFDTWNQYKADLHSHTTFSDGHNTLPEMAERHYELGFDIYAITDHGTNSTGFTNQKFNTAMELVSVIKNDGEHHDEVLSANGTAANGNAYKVETVNGDEYYSQTLANGNGQAMMRVPFGIEHNPTSFNNAHVNSFFVNYGTGIVGGTSNYIAPISKVQQLGGISVINHPGEYTNARDEVYTADAYNVENSHYNYVVNKYANILKNYDTCIGIDINSKGDTRTRFDRKLWDILLQKVVPSGRNVFAIGSTDAHNLDIVDSGYTVVLMPELTSAALKTALSTGTFFAASKYIGNVDELAGYSTTLLASQNAEAVEFGKELSECVDKINTEISENGSQGTKYQVEEGFAAPKVTNIVVDDAEDTITITAENALLVHWIADGKVIATGSEIDLDDYSDEIGSYVRAEILGKSGIMYSEPFTLNYDGAPVAEDSGRFVDFGTLASLICDTPVKILVFLVKTPVKVILDLIF